MPTTDRAVRLAKPRDKEYRITDGQGMSLVVHPNGRKVWILRYRLPKEKTYTLGPYPAVGLAQARAERNRAKLLILAGIDPVDARRVAVREAKKITFKQLMLDWHDHIEGSMTAQHHHQIKRALELHLFPSLGPLPADQITPARALGALMVLQEAGKLDTAKRCRIWASKAYTWGMIGEIVSQDPFDKLRGAIKNRKPRHFSKLSEKEVPQFLENLAKYQGDPVIRLALTLCLLTMVRTSVIRFATWSEFDLENRRWVIEGHRMKMDNDFIVPLSDWAIDTIQEVRQHSGRFKWVFPQARNRNEAISENAMLYAVYAMGYHNRTTVHGFRALAATVMAEKSGVSEKVIDRLLGHTERDESRAAYIRAEYLPERALLLQWWADYLRGREPTPVRLTNTSQLIGNLDC